MKKQKRLFESAKRSQVRLTERVVAETTAKNIDRENGVIRDVKVLGSGSLNGRYYNEDARKKAVELYENVPVRIDHKPDDIERPLIDDIGTLRGIYAKNDGVFAREFHVIKSHPLAEMVFEKAERFPESFGFSHQADGLVESDDQGVEEVVDLIAVESVDLVTRPATNKSLFESHQPKEGQSMLVKKKIKECVLNAPKGTKGRKRLMEMAADAKKSDVDVTEMEVEVPADATPEEELVESFRVAVETIANDAELTADQKLAMIVELLSQDAVAESEDADEEAVTESDEDEAKAEPVAEMEGGKENPGLPPTGPNPEGETVKVQEAIDKAVKPLNEKIKTLIESLTAMQKDNGQKSLRESVLREFEEAGINDPTNDQVDCAMNLRPKHRKTFLENIREASLSESYSRPRSSGRETGQNAGAYPADQESFMKALKF